MATINKKIEFRGMDHVPLLEEHINKQLKKFDNFLETKRDPISIDFVLEKHPDHAHDSAALRISVPMYETTIDIVVRREGPDLYKCIDEVCTIAHRDLMQAKQKLVDLRKVGKE
jgi:ribosome-associated translation inhibitor RaiA